MAFNSGDGHDVVVRATLRSGFSLEGKPMQVNDQGDALLANSDNRPVYFNLNDVALLEIINFEVMTSMLTDDSYVGVGPVPSLLQIKRRVSDMSASFESEYQCEVVVESLEDLSDAEKYQLSMLLDQLSAAIEQIAADDMGKEAVQSLKMISVKRSEDSLSVAKAGSGKLNVLVDLSKNIKSQGVDRLKNMIEAQF